AREGTSELERMAAATRALAGNIVVMTADSSDVKAVLAQASRSQAARLENDGQTRWIEDGWWLVPIVATFALGMFRRDSHQAVTAATGGDHK
ncbi:MAG: hypothetical protein MI861_18440, partial [Pirellulales bacterium]|nr:hypothetical protein [Pirellulales bacterium]